jgi:hypothetical protein
MHEFLVKRHLEAMDSKLETACTSKTSSTRSQRALGTINSNIICCIVLNSLHISHYIGLFGGAQIFLHIRLIKL